MFIVMAHRSGGVMPPASAPVKHEGEVLTFPTLEAAQDEAKRLNERSDAAFKAAGRFSPVSYVAGEA